MTNESYHKIMVENDNRAEYFYIFDAENILLHSLEWFYLMFDGKWTIKHLPMLYFVST